MRAVVQRVSQCRVESGGHVASETGPGLLVYLGVTSDDSERDLTYVADKALNLRVFDDEAGVMNRSLLEVGGEMMVVSQFTLYGDTRKGRRPSYNHAAAPETAVEVYRAFVARIQDAGVSVGTGVFQAHMDVVSVIDGPVTILIDSRKQF